MTFVRFEVLTVVCINLTVFPVVLCSLVDRYKYLGGKCFFHLLGIDFWMLKSLDPIQGGCSRLLQNFYLFFFIL